MNYKGLLILLFGGVLLILFMLAFVSNMYKDMMKITLEAEYVTITVADEAMDVKVILAYHNPERKNVPKRFQFPVAYAQNFSTPMNISVWMPTVNEKPTIGEKGATIEWSGNFGQQERTDIKIMYTQKLVLNQVLFPLKSDYFVRDHLMNAQYKVILPSTAKNVRCSYSDVTVREKDDAVILVFDAKGFTPEEDFIVEWD